MAGALVRIPDGLVRSAITLGEAQALLARRTMSAAEFGRLSMDEQIYRSFNARQLLVMSLIDGGLMAYIWSPSVGWGRAPIDYWLRAGDELHNVVGRAALPETYAERGDTERFVDAPCDLIGQSFAVWREDIEPWLGDDWGVPLTDTMAGDDRAAPDLDQYRELAQALDAARIPKRSVTATMIAERWSGAGVPKKESVIALMKGQPKGRQPAGGNVTRNN